MKKCGVIIEPVNILKPISLLQLFETEFASFERRPFAVSVLPYVLPYTQFFPEYNVDILTRVYFHVLVAALLNVHVPKGNNSSQFTILKFTKNAYFYYNMRDH